VNILGALIMGLFAGTLIATFGAMKDTRWEGFSSRKFVRSPIIAIVWSIIAFYAFEVGDLFICLGFSAGFERLTVEVWKGFIRRKKPSKFNSPERDTRWLWEDVEAAAQAARLNRDRS
jgi:hypothetical protein